jgi:glucosylceramidase
MLLPASSEVNFISNYLAPALSQAGLGTVILGGDDVQVNTSYADTLLNDPTTYNDLYATAWHCYQNNLGNMTTIHNSHPGKKIYESECSTGDGGIAPMNAAQLALESTFNWASGAELWNLALDTNGGPKMGAGCTGCTGLVTIDQSTGAATYTDNFYMLGQFSKFIVPGAAHIGSTDGGGVWSQAYRDPDGTEVLVAHNNNTSATTFTATWNSAGSFSYTLPAGATVTFTNGGNGTMQIVGQGSSRCLDDTGNTTDGVQQIIWDCTAGDSNQYYLYSANRELQIAGKCLGAVGNGTANGTKAITWDCNGAASQKWTFHRDGSITNDLSGLCLDVTAFGTANGSPVQLWSCTGNPNQKWIPTANT